MRKLHSFIKHLMAILLGTALVGMSVYAVQIPTSLNNALQYIMQTVWTSDGTASGTVNVDISTGGIYIATGFLQNGNAWNNMSLGLDTSGNVVYVPGGSSTPIFSLASNFIPKLDSLGSALEISVMYQSGGLIGVNKTNPTRSVNILGDFLVETQGLNVTYQYNFVNSNTGLGYPPVDIGTAPRCSCDLNANVVDCNSPSFASVNDQGFYCVDLTVQNNGNYYDHNVYVRQTIGIPSPVLSTSGANVGVRTNNPQAALDVSGDVRIATVPVGNGTMSLLVLGTNNTVSKVNPSIFGTSPWIVGSGQYSVQLIGDGTNKSLGKYSVVGGTSNTGYSTGGFIGGGNQNELSGSYGVIAGGVANKIANSPMPFQFAPFSNGFIGGGMFNSIVGYLGVVGGGYQNSINGNGSVILGGGTNTVTGDSNIIVGGDNNAASGKQLTIVGGSQNSVMKDLSIVGGGYGNTTNANYAAILGGQSNSITSNRGAVVGGYNNMINGMFSFIGGGENNIANGSHSMAAGQNAQALHNDSFVWNSSTGTTFASTTGGQFLINAYGGVGINTGENLYKAGSNPLSYGLTVNGFVMSNGSVMARNVQVFDTRGTGINDIFDPSGDMLLYNTLLYTGANSKVVIQGNNGLFGASTLDVVINPYGGGRGGPQANVGIGMFNPQYKLDVNGTVRGIGPFNQTSDGKYKTNEAPITNALNKITSLNGISYVWDREKWPDINFDNRTHLGFIAQDVQPIIPEAVSVDADGNYSMAYTEIIPVLVEAMKEQQAQITALEARVTALETP